MSVIFVCVDGNINSLDCDSEWNWSSGNGKQDVYDNILTRGFNLHRETDYI